MCVRVCSTVCVNVLVLLECVGSRGVVDVSVFKCGCG